MREDTQAEESEYRALRDGIERNHAWNEDELTFNRTPKVLAPLHHLASDFDISFASNDRERHCGLQNWKGFQLVSKSPKYSPGILEILRPTIISLLRFAVSSSKLSNGHEYTGI
jgi:hypothetical protein